MPPFLTVLTTPIPTASRRAYQNLRRAVRPLVRRGAPPATPQPYPGHAAVTRSVVEGLRAVDADFNFNPRRMDDLGRVVYAPANEALRQSAAMKREGRVDFLAAGPINAFAPHECDRILFTPEIDQLIVASEWVRDLYRREAPELDRKLRVCPCGVDAGAWAPVHDTPSARVVVYWKSGTEAFCDDVTQRVRAHGFETVRIRYGAYDASRFRAALDGALAAVFLSSFETQGLALAEAWSMNVPTLVWDPRGRTEWNGWSFEAGSSAPFLTPQTGAAWRLPGELDALLENIARERHRFAPRAWVLASMTDAICAGRLLDVIRQGVGVEVAS